MNRRTLCLAVGLGFTLLLAACSHSGKARLHKGDTVPAFTTVDVGGRPLQVSFPENRRTIILVFLASCSVCERQVPLWTEAFATRPPHTDVVAILVDQEPPGYWTDHPLPFTIVRTPSREFLHEQYHLHSAPSMLRVGPNGRVEDIQVGLASNARIHEIFGS